ncbi:ran guanine nucleotide release factor isoform X2 [Phyllopteryx taeniolatus]|uniref:ran guanine nucleotide release factor isoform X2 n=1 Tax=Phyllopteryx taeniolatus TaxID=161469 RepID=UPI002AD299EA|nr:ran guanine nucleotide release factor isoform X2 [Phyllopteryx taeniolatus]
MHYAYIVQRRNNREKALSNRKQAEPPSKLAQSNVIQVNNIQDFTKKVSGVKVSRRHVDMQRVNEPHPLFGGALSAVLPHSAADVSKLREIPDNQEAFVHARTDQSLIVELVEYQAHVADQDAARYHFEDIAGNNAASQPGAQEVTGVVALHKSSLSLSACSCAWALTGTQCVSKFNETARNRVRLHLGVFRLPQFGTDVLVTFNDPQSICPDSSSSPAAVGAGVEPWTAEDFQQLLQSLTLHNPGLFG